MYAMEDIVKGIMEYAPVRIFFSLFKPSGFARRSAEQLALSTAELFDVYGEIERLQKVYNDSIESPFSIFNRDRKLDVDIPRCFATCRQWKIDPIGQVYPCPQLSSSDYVVGMVQDGLMACIYSNEARKVFEKIWARARVIGDCTACFWRSLCQAGCPARSKAYTGSVLYPDDLCAIRQAYFVKTSAFTAGLNDD